MRALSPCLGRAFRSRGRRICDPGEEDTDLVGLHEAQEVLGRQAAARQIYERKGQENREGVGGSFVGARICCDIEAEALLGGAQEGAHGPVTGLATVAEDVAAVLQLSEGAQERRQGLSVFEVGRGYAWEEEDREGAVGRRGALEVGVEERAQPDRRPGGVRRVVIAEAVEGNPAGCEAVVQGAEGVVKLLVGVGPEQSSVPVGATVEAVGGGEERAGEAVEEGRRPRHCAASDPAPPLAFRSRAACLKARVKWKSL